MISNYSAPKSTVILFVQKQFLSQLSTILNEFSFLQQTLPSSTKNRLASCRQQSGNSTYFGVKRLFRGALTFVKI